jgi:hypothetical protein
MRARAPDGKNDVLQLREHVDRARRMPTLLVRLSPGRRCGACGQMGYVEAKSGTCLACLNRGLLRWAKRELEKRL